MMSSDSADIVTTFARSVTAALGGTDIADAIMASATRLLTSI
jgi:hypothetical protein